MSGENDWAAEGVIQFIKSPMWTVPVHDFIDSNCVVFDNDEEMKFEYSEIHKKFQVLIDDLLSTYLDELGFPQEQFVEVIQQIDERSQGQNADIKRLLEYLMYLDDFVSFRSLMQRRNVELELEVMRAIQRENESTKESAKAEAHAEAAQQGKELSPEEQEQLDLELALKASMQDAEVVMKSAEAEDAELQQALIMSMKAEEERLARENAKREEAHEAEKEQARQQAAAAQRQAEEVQAEEAAKKAALEEEKARAEAESKARIAAMQEQNTQQRAQVVANAVNTAKQVAPEVAEIAIQKKAEPTNATAPAATASTTAPAQPSAPAPDVVHVSSSQGNLAPASSGGLAPIGGRGLPPVGSRSGTFGPSRGVLPSIHSFGEIKAAVAPIQPQQPLTDPKKEEAAKKIAEPTKEEMEARAQKMREQRDRILAAKKAQRAEELSTFKTENGIEQSPDPKPPAAADGAMDDAHKQITMDIARRFKADILGSTRD